MNTMHFYQTNKPAWEIFNTEEVAVTETPSFQVSHSASYLYPEYFTNGNTGLQSNASLQVSNGFKGAASFSTADSTVEFDGSYSTNIESRQDELVRDSFRLRHEVFAEQLQWDVVSYQGREVDHYDVMNPWYALLENRDSRVVGTWRALPTTGGYMLRDIFPELCRGEAMPCDENIWEISRFAIDKYAQALEYSDDCVCEPVRQLVDSFEAFSKEKKAKALVAVTSTAGERMLRRMGMPLRRMGDGKSMKIGKVQSTAILLDVDAFDDREKWAV